LLAWIAFAHYQAHGEVLEAVAGVIFVLALFGIVVLHELGHALAARRYGIPTRDITLLPIGGVARLERMPEDPRQEFVVALAGPAVNVFLAAGIFATLTLGEGLAPLSQVMRAGGHFLSQLFWINVTLAVFNLLPAFPMDGGRVLRALLAMRLNYLRATQIAAGVGQGLAILFGFIGVLGLLGLPFNPLLLFIALFVWLGAEQESQMVQFRAALQGVPVQSAMITNFQTLHPGDSLSKAVDYFVGGYHHDFPVVDGERVVGMLARSDLTQALERYGPGPPVGRFMRSQFSSADPHEMLTSVLPRLQRGTARTIPVVEDGQLVGLLSADNLADVLMLRTAKQGAQSAIPDAGGSPGIRLLPKTMHRRPQT
jgi:Zn-dependent protease/CBS domain-containing protein